MHSQNKTFESFLSHRWHTFYKPIVSIIGIIALLIVILSGIVLGLSQLWELVTKIDTRILKVILPVISLTLVILLIEYSAYKEFMKTDFIPNYSDLVESTEENE